MKKSKKIDKVPHCSSCLTELLELDKDVNGKMDTTCAKCKAEQEHDYDAEPDVKFDRAGHVIEK